MKKRLLSLSLALALLLPAVTVPASAADGATRRDLAEALYELDGKPAVTKTIAYKDLTDADSALYWISEEGLMMGFGQNQMGPDRTITREQLATVLYR